MAIIRDAKEMDLDNINAILRKNRQIDDVEKDDISDFVVAELGGKVVGCGMLKEYKKGVEISKVSVLPDHQGKGLGMEITMALLGRAKGRKCWLTSVRTHGFWELFGFHIVPEREAPREMMDYCRRCKQQRECDRVVMFREGD
jgi:N-acetylglutamate synthase-like GNAT family acetyltransferase